MRKPIKTEEVVAGLRRLADDIEAGRRPTPRSGSGLYRAAGVPVVPIAVHDALCGWRVASLQEDTNPPILACAGCGLGFLELEAATLRGQS